MMVLQCQVKNAIGDICGAVKLVPGMDVCYRCSSRTVKDSASSIEAKYAIMSKEHKGYYLRKLNPKLQEAILNQRAQTKLNDIAEEIELVRMANEKAVEVYSATQAMMDMPEAIAALGGGIDDESMARGKARLAIMFDDASKLLKEAMRENADLVEKAAKIHNLTVDRLSPDAIADIAKQITSFVHIIWGHDWDGLERFDKLLSAKLNLPSVVGNMGTTITPSQEVRKMDSTVPLWVEPTE